MKTLIFDLDDTLFDSSGRDTTNGDLAAIKPFDGVIEFLKTHPGRKILVTRGDKKYQNQKIDILGLRNYFDEIHICPTYDGKLEIFKRVLKHLNPRKVIVVGDRIDNEIRYANMLGLKTIHLKHGKNSHLKSKDKFEIPDHTIEKFAQITEIVN